MADIPDPVLDAFGDLSKPKTSLGYRIVQVFTVLGIGLVLLAFMLPATRRAREPARRLQCMNYLKQIGLALHSYHEVYNVLPPAYTVDANGKPLHSWRTLLLPFIDQAALYETIDLSKPWNDPANAKAYATRIQVYECPSSRFTEPPFKTTYLAVVTPNSSIRPGQSLQLREITDGLSNTLFVIEVPAEQAVHWMSPLDADANLVLSFAPETKLNHEGGFDALLGDGSVRFISVKTPADVRRAFMSATGGEVVGDF